MRYHPQDDEVGMSRSVTCSVHPEQLAAFHCPQCRTDQCSSCADHRWMGSGFADLCRKCQTQLAVLEQHGREPGVAPPPGTRAYLARLPQFVAFPFRRDTLFVLFWLAASVSLLRWLPWLLPGLVGIALLVLSLAMEIAVYIHFVTRTALGKEGLRPEDLDELQRSVIAPAGRYVLALVPLGLGLLWLFVDVRSSLLALLGHELHAGWLADLLLASLGPALLVVAGLLLLPLLTIIAAMGSARSVIDPRMWLVVLRSVGSTYPAGTIAFYAVWAVESLVWLPLLQHARAEWSIPVLTTVLVTFLSYLPMALRARLLGGIIEPHREYFE
jgi:hypothetical protein